MTESEELELLELEDQEKSAAAAADSISLAIKNPISAGVGNLASKAGEQVDIFSGSRAARHAIGAGLDQPEDLTQWGPAQFAKTAITDFAKSYGRDIESPSGYDLTNKSQYTKDLPEPVKKGIGIGADITLDPSLLIPVGGATKALSIGAEGVVEGTKLGIRGAGKMASGAGKALDVLSPGASDLIKIPAKKALSIAETVRNYIQPAVSPEYAEMVRIAKQYDIPVESLPSSVKYQGGPASTISKLERVRAQGPIGEPHLKSFNESLGTVRSKLNKKIEDIGGGVPVSPTEAGESLRNAYNKEVDQFLSNNDITYSKVSDIDPQLELDKIAKEKIISRLEDEKAKANEIMHFSLEGEEIAQAKVALNQIENMQRLVFDGNYNRVVGAMKSTGSRAFKKSAGAYPSGKDIQRSMYHIVSDEITDNIGRNIDPGLAEQLRTNNKSVKEFLDNQKRIGLNMADGNISGERLFKDAVESGDSVRIRALKEHLKNDPEALGKLKGTFLESLKIADADGGFSFRRLQSALQNDEKTIRIFNELFTPEEASAIKDLVRLGDAYGNPILNTSGTETSRVMLNWIKNAPQEMSQNWFIDFLKKSARVDPETAGKIGKLGVDAKQAGIPSTVKRGSPTMKLTSDVMANPGAAVKEYISNLKPTRRQVLGKGLQEYSIQKDQQAEAPQERHVEIIRKLQGRPGTQKFVGALQNASQNSQEAVSVTDFILQQTEPEYQKALQEE